MTKSESKQPLWKKKRWIAAAVLAVVLVYPVSFIPACWTLMLIAPDEQSVGWRTMQLMYRPMASVVIDSPEPLRDAVERLGNLAKTERVEFDTSEAGIAIVTRYETGPIRAALHVIWSKN